MSFTEAVNEISLKLNDWLEGFVNMLPNIILAILVFLLTWLIASLVKKYLYKFTGRFLRVESGRHLIAVLGSTIIILVGLFLILSVLDLDNALAGLITGAGILGLAVGLALQDPLVNIFSGIIITLRNYYYVGNYIETQDLFGKVVEIKLRSTRLKKTTGEYVIIPNRLILKDPLINYNYYNQRRVDLECGVEYGENLPKVQQTARAALGEEFSLPPDEVEIFFTEFGDSSINFIARFWIEFIAQKDYVAAQSRAIVAMKSAFDANDITIPFPIRTLDFNLNEFKGKVNTNEKKS